MASPTLAFRRGLGSTGSDEATFLPLCPPGERIRQKKQWARYTVRTMPDDPTEVPSVLTGIDVLARDKFAALFGASVGLVTNHTGLLRDGKTATADALHAAPNVSLRALFAPEHGIRGAVDAPVLDATDDATGLPVYSLYGARQEPTPEMLTGLDTLVYDIQDIGTRFYTYLSTLGHVLHVAGATGLRVVVCDRPNPIGGVAVEGSLSDDTRLSFTAFHPIPVRHGMTLGELALLLNAERGFNANVTVVKCEGWRRTDYYDATGLLWTNPSPNMRSANAALTYPGVGLLEFTNISVGRGTDTPFEIVAAPWINARAFAHALNTRALPGVRFVPITVTPRASLCAGELCGGVQIIVTDRVKFVPVRTGFEIALTLRALYENEWQASKYMTLLANRSVMDGLLAGEYYAALSKRWQPDLRGFLTARKEFLLYE